MMNEDCIAMAPVPDSTAPPGPVMLALSTFRRSERAVETALEEALEIGELVLVNVVDVNLARYFVGINIGLYPDVKKTAEAELLEIHRQHGRERMRAIADRAESMGLSVRVHVRTGRFALVCLEIAEQVQPSLIVTCRSRRPSWVKRVFGSPVTHLISHAPCPVLEVPARSVSLA